MCPACMASAGLIVGSLLSRGVFATLLVKVQSEMAANMIATQAKSKEEIS
jgi:hypothetical protein